MKHYLAAIFSTALLSLTLALSGVALAQDDASGKQGAESMTSMESVDSTESAESSSMDSAEVAAVTVNVNEADAQAIADALIDVGLVRAQAIVDYRETHGRFYTAEELTAIKGIGSVTVKRNLERIRLK